MPPQGRPPAPPELVPTTLPPTFLPPNFIPDATPSAANPEGDAPRPRLGLLALHRVRVLGVARFAFLHFPALQEGAFPKL